MPKSPISRRRFLVGLVAVGLVACTRTPGSIAPVTSGEPSLLATPSRNIWPLQYRQAPAAVKEAYAFAVSHSAILRFVPCFCGCGANGHVNNYDCFVRAESTAGTFALDSHGFGCGTCVGVALQTKALVEQGLPIKSIRQRIDASWSSVGPATRTPLPDE
jgi:hypothetical protein